MIGLTWLPLLMYASRVARSSILLLLLCLVCPAQTQKSNPFAGQPREIDAGRASFRLRCSACHGMRAQGGQGPDLTRGHFEAGDSDLDLFRVISQGVPGTEMPAFGARNTEESIWRIITYLRSLTPKEATAVRGNPKSGAHIFWGKGGCGACHRAGAKGGRFGPNLSRIGRSRSLAHLRESVLEPNKDFPSGYYAVSVVTADGKQVSGIGLNYDNFSAQFIDAQGSIHSFLRTEVKSMKREFRSLMPTNYGESLNESELDDLLAYLADLRGEGSGR